MINPETDIAAVILCGGKGSRMGGADKGLQAFNGVPLALNALFRIQTQVAETCINANRNIGVYEGFGVPVVCDTYPDYPGPLAGFHAGLVNTNLPYLMTVPCDVPLFPEDLVINMAQAFQDMDDTELVVARSGGKAQPVFCLMNTQVIGSLETFLRSGQGKIDRWYDQLKTAYVDFENEKAFHNLNTLDELHQFESGQT